MDSETVIKRTNKALATAIDDEVVMFDADAGKYYGLNSVAAAVWNLLEEPLSIGNICDQLISEYDVEKEKCLDEILGFLPELQQKGLIEIAE
ncbi:MAG TPA: PqqD family peptide modification chaperone [Balneolaceae bacterium]|nr:PqqD family peptide modification chaperone [Balneolaceae bacterium]